MPWRTTGDDSNYELRIDINELVGGEISEADAILLGQRAIDIIVERTRDNKDVSGKKFKAYSKEYKNSFEFGVFGKSNNVNLTLEGSMLNLLQVKSIEDNEIVIGWNFDDENAKGFNHNTGDTLPKREFLGLRPNEVSQLRRDFEPNIIEEAPETLRSLFRRLFG